MTSGRNFNRAPPEIQSLQLPTFFILGAPKCGTTALAQYLGSHPDVCISLPKEPHFFDANYEMGLEHYASAYFRQRGSVVAAGEATPSYLMVPYVAQRIRDNIPHARLIVCLRNPVERAYSSWWMLYSRGMEQLDFGEAISAELAQGPRLEDADAEARWRRQVQAIRAGEPLPLRTYLEGGAYARHLERYLSLFSREQVYVVLSRELRLQPNETVGRLWRFLGVSDDVAIPAVKPVNQAIGARTGSAMRLAQRMGLMPVRRFLPDRFKSWLKKGLSAVGSQPEVDSADRTRLTEYFAPQNCRLESLLRIDVSDWN